MIVDQVPLEILHKIISYISPKDRYNLRNASSYLFTHSWIDSELDFIYCPFSNHINRYYICMSKGHLNCIKYLPIDKFNKFTDSILLGSQKIYKYYVDTLYTKLSSDFYIKIISESNINALNIINDNIDLKIKLSFYLDGIIDSTLDFVKRLVEIIYDNNYLSFYEDFGSQIIERDRDDIMNIICDSLTDEDIIGKDRIYVYHASKHNSPRILKMMKYKFGNITPLRDLNELDLSIMMV